MNIIDESLNNPIPFHEKSSSISFNDAVHAILKIIDIGKWEYFIRKKFWKKKNYPDWIMQDLYIDYIKYVKDLDELWLRTAENYNLTQSNSIISVEQFLFPEGTALDNLSDIEDNDILDKIISDIIISFLIPILEKSSIMLNNIESSVFFDASLKNFAILTGKNWEIKNYYIDFFIPRIREDNWKIKEYKWNLHKHNSDIIEYRFFFKPWIINNFIRKTYLDLKKIWAKKDFINHFLEICDKLLEKYLVSFFKDKKSIDLAKTDFNISLIDYEKY